MQKVIVNSKDVKILIEKDPVIKQISDQYGLPPSWEKEEGFITLAKIILGQQVSLSAAEAHFQKLNHYLPKFIPEKILELSDEEMRNCFISRQKARYLRELSQALISKELILEDLGKKPAEEVRQQLTAIKGIGTWTANIYLMFCLKSKDIFPVKDIAVIHTIEELYKIEEGEIKERIQEISDSWRPLRTLGTYFMWHYYLSKRGRASII